MHFSIHKDSFEKFHENLILIAVQYCVINHFDLILIWPINSVEPTSLLPGMCLQHLHDCATLHVNHVDMA
jgi:hypothetical protein